MQSQYYDMSVLEKSIESLSAEFSQIPESRRSVLRSLAEFITTKVDSGDEANLLFICTHNSRRSHIAQIWAQTAAAHYHLKKVRCYSGGTEATAFNSRAVSALNAAGFKIKQLSDSLNPLYEVQYSDDSLSMTIFSKKYDNDENPKDNFCAVMTCAEADANCPVIAGATTRIALSYNDPKEYDDTSEEKSRYSECVQQIGREILYAFSLCK
jgi:arsenate reductase